MDMEELLILLLAVWALVISVALITLARKKGPIGYTGQAGWTGPQGPKGDKGDALFAGQTTAETLNPDYFIKEPDPTFNPQVHTDPLSGRVFFTGRSGMELSDDSDAKMLRYQKGQLQARLEEQMKTATRLEATNDDLRQANKQLISQREAFRDNKLRIENKLGEMSIENKELNQANAELLDVRSALRKNRDSNEREIKTLNDALAEAHKETYDLFAEKERLEEIYISLRDKKDELLGENTRLKKTKRFYENKFIPNGPKGEE